jgi:hypothetical protein
MALWVAGHTDADIDRDAWLISLVGVYQRSSAVGP